MDPDTGRLLYYIVEAFQMLDVQGTDDVNPLCKYVLDILVPFFIPAARHVGVRQFIDEDNLWFPGQNGINVHLLNDNPAVFLPPPGDNFQTFEKLGDVDPPVCFHKPHDHVDPLVLELVRFLEHSVGLTHAGGISEVYLQVAALGPADHPQESICAILNGHILFTPIQIQV